MKNREIEELLAEHQRIVEKVDEEWRGEVDEAKGQMEELRDVSLSFIFAFPAHLTSLLLGPRAARCGVQGAAPTH